MPGPEEQRERQRQRMRSQDCEQQRQQLRRLAINNSHMRWFQQVLQRPDVDQMFERWCQEYEGFEEFMKKNLCADLDG